MHWRDYYMFIRKAELSHVESGNTEVEITEVYVATHHRTQYLNTKVWKINHKADNFHVWDLNHSDCKNCQSPTMKPHPQKKVYRDVANMRA